MSGRPPADDFIKEAIFDQKCVGKDAKQFNQWCMAGNGTVASTCKDIQGNSGDCQFMGTFNTSTKESASFSYEYRCKYGASPEKWNNKSDVVPVEKAQLEKIMLFCEQELFGKPYILPWWIILLIVLGCILGLTIAISLFWRLWLREKLNKRNNKSNISNYTSAPFSTSNVEPGASRAPQASATNRGSFATLHSGIRSGSGHGRRSSHKGSRSNRSSNRLSERSR